MSSNKSANLNEITEKYNQGIGTLLWQRRIDDIETPISAFAKLGAEKFGSCLFESVEGGENRGRYSIVASNPDLLFSVEGRAANLTEIDESGVFGKATNIDGNPLDALKKLLDENKLDFPSFLPSPLAGLYGYVGYEMVRFYEKLPIAARDPLELPYSMLMRPRLVIVFDGVKQEMILATPIRPKDGIDAATAIATGQKLIDETIAKLSQPNPLKAPDTSKPTYFADISSNQTPAQYMAGVEKARAHIRAGDIFQVVPSQRFSIDFDKSPLALYRALRRTNPSPFLFILQMNGFSIIGSSPEILVRLRDGTVTVRPIAGTRPRGETQAKDLALEEELLNDPKEVAEHLMLLDLGRNDVGRVSINKAHSNQERNTNFAGGIRVTQKFVIERYSHVMHIVSNVEGTLKPELTALDALLAGFPAGTVSGAPKIRAMEIISELEPHERGIYAGGVGYFSANGDMDICIALRTGVLKDNKLYIQAGAGVVLDSDPEKEHLECIAKSRALVSAASEAVIYE
ncbi:anthranilate synthase component I [Pseudaquidulcibacter saccharophilus]|uniref:anthranilate synthase component I n=1 Tax=Pseudaquidulcibacter saccharophilus TaxID=2831900 RepID=UPI001EFF5164|nr:anthranilate synthase component I [Pseudaquidulcibacter saccharophilus]